jgi:hypothetical protein
MASKPKPGLHRVLKLAIARLVPVVREKIEGRRCRAGAHWAAKTRSLWTDRYEPPLSKLIFHPIAFDVCF